MNSVGLYLQNIWAFHLDHIVNIMSFETVVRVASFLNSASYWNCSEMVLGTE